MVGYQLNLATKPVVLKVDVIAFCGTFEEQGQKSMGRQGGKTTQR